MAESESPALLFLIDTHQHLWNLSQFHLPWLENAPEALRRSFTSEDYMAATRGFEARAIYMEVDVDPAQHVAEAEHVIGLCRSEDVPTIAAVIGGRPAAPDFQVYLNRFRDEACVKGVRQVLHTPQAPPSYCLHEDFVRGIQLLGERGLSFDLCMRPVELQDGVKLAQLCPHTRFVVDHCGNADPNAFRPSPRPRKLCAQPPWHEPDLWRRDMELLAQLPNVICKISGIVARAPKHWTAEDLAPIVNHCFDVFGPERVVFGGDWPVCLTGAALPAWISALEEIVAQRPDDQQRQLWHENAMRWYGIPSSVD